MVQFCDPLNGAVEVEIQSAAVEQHSVSEDPFLLEEPKQHVCSSILETTSDLTRTRLSTPLRLSSRRADVTHAFVGPHLT